MNADNSLSLRVLEKNRSHWENKHQNYRQRIAGLINVWNPELGEASPMEGLKATVSGLQSLIESTAGKRRQLKPLGSEWSISRIAATPGRLLHTKPLNWNFDLSPESVSTDHTGEVEDLTFIQCGTSIFQINEYLDERNRSLKTSGARNGQTIAGAISTGTPGSAFRVGAMQNHVERRLSRRSSLQPSGPGVLGSQSTVPSELSSG